MLVALLYTMVVVQSAASISLYKSNLSIGDWRNRAGMHLESSPYPPWTSNSFALCFRANLGLLTSSTAGVTPVHITRVLEKDDLGTAGVFILAAVSPHPYLAFGSSGDDYAVTKEGTERYLLFNI